MEATHTTTEASGPTDEQWSELEARVADLAAATAALNRTLPAIIGAAIHPVLIDLAVVARDQHLSRGGLLN